MKQPLHFTLLLLLFIPVITQSQDSAFTLKGILKQPSAINSFTIFYPRMNMDSMRIQADGSFSFSGNISEAGEVQIGIKETSVKIWVEPGLTQLYLSEKPDRNGKLQLTVDSVSGTEDTYLYYYTLLPKTGKPILTNIKGPVSFISKEQEIRFKDSLSKVYRPFSDSLHKSNAYKELDSVFKIRPDSKVLPFLIRFYAPILGIEYVQEFFYRLTLKQQQTIGGGVLLNYLTTLNHLSPGIVFEDFNMKDNHGKKFRLSSLQSKYVLLDFWASWCSPCRANHPFMREVYLKYKQQGLEIISISLDEEKQNWLEAIQKDKLTWINVSDLKGWENQLSEKYKVSGIPFSILLDENRRVILVNPNLIVLNNFFKEQALK